MARSMPDAVPGAKQKDLTSRGEPAARRRSGSLSRVRGRAAREGTGTAAGGWLPARLPVLLLGAKHGVLQALRETELADALRRNLDRLAGLWITAHPRLAIREDQLPEPRQQEHAALLGFLGREVERLVEDAFDLLPGEAGLLRKVRNRRGLRHRLRHR